MSTTLTATAKASLSWDFENVNANTGNTTFISSYTYSRAFTNGTAINCADLLYVTSGTIAGAGTASFDLAASLTDRFGNTITGARVKAIYCEHTTDTTSTGISFGGDAAPLVNWISDGTATLSVRNGGCFFLCAPDATAYAITATTGDVVLLTNADGTNTATYKLAFLMASA